MKLDKETLIKEHFWFLSGLVVVMVLVSLVLLASSARTNIETEKKKFENRKGELGRIKASNDPNTAPKNNDWLGKLDDKLKEANAQERKIWKAAWDEQFQDPKARFMIWPAKVEDRLSKLSFGDQIDDTTLNDYGNAYFNKDGPGDSQLIETYKLVQPEIVQFRDPWYTMIRWVSNGWKVDPPTPEDVWLAQEDLWVQTGLLKIIRTTNDQLAEMKVTSTVSEQHKVFANVNWLLDLDVSQMEGNKPVFKYKLTNIGRRRQIMPIKFQVALDGADVPPLEVSGEPLTPGKSIASSDKGIAITGLLSSPKSISAVKQIFDWRTVPIKRIDQIQMGVHSVRTAGVTLLPPRFIKKEEKKDDAQGGGGERGTGKMAPQAGAGGGPGGGGADARSPNGLERNRYVEVSEQVRRMPVGMALVVDQAHIQEVLTAFANSPLRIQTTQWYWRRFHGDIKPKDEESAPPASGVAAEEGRPRAQGTKPPPGSSLPSFRPMTGAAMTSSGEDQQDWDLVELAVYGVASLYERYKAPEEATASSTTGKTPPAAGTK